jgi:hypothetical protein
MKRFLLILSSISLLASAAFAQRGEQAILSPAPATSSSVTFTSQAIGTPCAASASITTCASAAFGSNTGAGNTIAVMGCWAGTAGTGGASNSLSSVAGQGSFTVITGSLINYGVTTNYSNVGCEWAIAYGIPGGATTAETCTFANLDNVYWCNAFQLTAATNSLSNVGHGDYTGTGNLSTTSITPTGTGNFALDATIQDDGSGCDCGYTQGASWTLATFTGGGSYDAAAQYIAQAAMTATTSPITTNRNPALWVDSQIVVQP